MCIRDSLGAADYITKPFDVDEMRAIVARAVARREEALVSNTGAVQPDISLAAPSARANPGRSRTPGRHGTMILGESTAMSHVWDLVRRAAAAPKTTVLITGESGTGKELVACLLYTSRCV